MNGNINEKNAIPKTTPNNSPDHNTTHGQTGQDDHHNHQHCDVPLLPRDSHVTVTSEKEKGDEEGEGGGRREEEDEQVIEMEQVKEKKLIYKVSEPPPLRLLLLFTLQQGLLPVSAALSVSALVSEVTCGRDDGDFRTQLLSGTFLMIGLSTFCMSTFGIRLPIFQGPSSPYIIPLFALMSMKEWQCPSQEDLMAYHGNSTANMSGMTEQDLAVPKELVEYRARQLSGSLMAAGGLHFLIGVTGLVGFMLRFIGPVTIVPAITLVGLYLYKIVVKFSQTNWPVAILVAGMGIVLSLYLGKRSTPIPTWSRERGFHIKWFPLHQVFAVLISIIFGWIVSVIFTHMNWLSKDRNSVQFYARTDTQLHVIGDAPWVSFPYPGQFGVPLFHPGVFLSFFLATLLSVLDSIGDYNACARMCYVPRPPAWAVNRGIAVEGLMSLLSGGVGTGQATVSFGGNIGAIGLTRVASRRVFQAVGIMYVLLAIFSKVGAVLTTVPYSVLGGTQILTVGIFIGIVLSNLQHVDLALTRNVAVIGIALLLGLMVPYWVSSNPTAIQTGNGQADRMLSILLSNPVFVGGFLACFLDNTLYGTLKQRGIILDDPPPEDKESAEDAEKTLPEDDDDDDDDDEYVEGLEVYDLPWLPACIKRSALARFLPIFPGDKKRDRGFTGMNM